MMMLILVAGICSVGFAEESPREHSSANVQYRFTSGGFWTCGSNFSGGFGEFGINLLPKEKGLVLRNCIFVQGSGGHLAKNDQLEFDSLDIGNKLILGGRVNCPGFIVRSYGFAAISLGLFSCQGHPFATSPFLLNLSYGGGFEFQFTSRNAFVLEFGGLSGFLAGQINPAECPFTDFSNSSPLLTIGFRSFI